MVQGGELGKINYLHSNQLNFGRIRTEENILWSFAPHDISVMLLLLNEMPVRVNGCANAAAGCYSRKVHSRQGALPVT